MRKTLYTTLLFFLFLIPNISFGHSVQVAYCVDANGNLQIFVEHWHGTENPSSTTMTMQFVTGGVTTTTTGSPTGSYINVPLGSLPGCASSLTPFGSCPAKANNYNDWVQYSFNAVPCGTSIQLIVLSGNTVFTQDCGGMYPASTALITLPCPINPITVSDQTVCSGTPFNSVNFTPQAAVVYNWTNDNTAIGIPASGTGNIGATTTPFNTNDVVANFSVNYYSTADPTNILNETFTLTALASPQAGFTATDFCEGYPSTFANTSSNTSIVPVNSWIWDFGDGSANFTGASPPPHTFPGAGPYTVSLTVSNGICSDTYTSTFSAQPQPVAEFISSIECYGSITSFTDQSTGTISSYAWDFTNNQITDITTQNPTNGYPSANTYDVQLTVTSDKGCIDSINHNVVVNPIPVASFSSSTVCDYETTSFMDASSVSLGSIANYNWDFGDGSGTSTGQSPTYAYGSSGTYNATLTVTSNQGCINNTVQPVTVNVKPVADFSYSDFCVGYPATFNDISATTSPLITGWEWDFGDGSTTETTQIPSAHTFPATGPYTVQLIVNNTCLDTITYVLNANPTPVASFTHTTECDYDLTEFTNTSTISAGSITGYAWDFEDNSIITATTDNATNNYNGPATYTAQLIVTSNLGCIDSVTNPVLVNPVPVADFSVAEKCDYETSSFVDLSSVYSGNIASYSWDFGDGSGTSSQQSPLYPYGVAGTYNASLLVISDQGCRDSITNIVKINPKPTASFTFTDVCLGLNNVLTDNSNGNGSTITNFEWDFDSNTSIDASTQNTAHEYPSYGFFNPTLYITTQYGCKDTATNQVEVYEIPVPNYSFASVCEGQSVNFNNTSFINTGSITGFSWDFDNANTSILENPTELFVSENNYDVAFTVTSNNGCTASTNQIVDIYPLPNPGFTVPDVCDGQISNFTDVSTVSNTYTTNNIISWDWNFGNGVTFNGQNALYLYATADTFNVSLQVLTNNGCTYTYNDISVVHPNPEIAFTSPNPEGCDVWCADFTNATSIASGSISSYMWDFGNSETSIMQDPTSCFENKTLADMFYDVELTATSDQGCSSSYTESDIITVFPIPVADFEAVPPISDIYNTTFQFNNQSLIANLFDWDVAGLETFNDQDIEYTFSDADSGTYEICLQVTSVHGCVHDTCNSIYIQGYSNLYIANAFTPDADGVNDYFKPSLYGFSPENYQFKVFDRWGALLYNTNNILDRWDGTYNGTISPQDVYVWKVEAVDKYTSEPISLTGHVTLVK